jgi:hypothetical protein
MLRFDVPIEIQAALLGGLIAGAVVLIGVSLSEALTRGRERWTAMREELHRIVMRLPVALIYLGPNPPDPARVSFGSPGWAVEREVTDALFKIEALARGRRGKRYEEVKKAADDLTARFSAALMRAHNGQYLSYAEMLEIAATQLTRAILGEREHIDQLFKQYVREGFPPSRDEN